MQSFKDLDAYKVSQEAAVLVYRLSQSWPKEEIFGLTSQIRRAAVSVNSNLAEGCGRATDKDSLQFFAIARGSCNELEAQAELAFRLGYLVEDNLRMLLTINERSRRLVNGLMNRYQTRKVRPPASDLPPRL